MELLIPIDLKNLADPIRYGDRIFLTGSCFTEHIGNALSELKFRVLQNPHGILFGADSVCRSLNACVHKKKYTPSDLFYLNECWNSWDHHSRYSSTDLSLALKTMNEKIDESHEFLAEADWLIITLGSSFTYKLTPGADLASLHAGDSVANCHRAPQSWFSKQMMATGDIIRVLNNSLDDLKKFNPSLKFIFTISPVRHIRDGVVENNRSKARLISSVQDLVENRGDSFYFPSYELLIDVLRDYRFYDIDLVHPNYAATEFVFEKFMEYGIDPSAASLMKEVKKLVTARKHRAFQPNTASHQKFLESHLEKARQLQEEHPFLDLSKEIDHFSRSIL
ncbi:MAG: GSCFA domain-containing protein [Chitinophagaceae bacterium]|nr:GSCFA domain-containing protein [Chitinophagaceae bacterium]